MSAPEIAKKKPRHLGTYLAVFATALIAIAAFLIVFFEEIFVIILMVTFLLLFLMFFVSVIYSACRWEKGE